MIAGKRGRRLWYYGVQFGVLSSPRKRGSIFITMDSRFHGSDSFPKDCHGFWRSLAMTVFSVIARSPERSRRTTWRSLGNMDKIVYAKGLPRLAKQYSQ